MESSRVVIVVRIRRAMSFFPELIVHIPNANRLAVSRAVVEEGSFWEARCLHLAPNYHTDDARRGHRRTLSDRIDQFGRADLQRSGDLNDVVKRDVPLPAFDLGDVVAMNISPIRQLLLADLPLFPQCSDSLSKLNEDIPHPHMVGYMLTIGL
jgi:hypothetical protein